MLNPDILRVYSQLLEIRAEGHQTDKDHHQG